MRWEGLFAAVIFIIIIFWYEWPRMKQNPKKDKFVFCTLIFLGLVLSMFDLPNMKGPTTWITSIFKPFGNIMESWTI